jgi:hypothetical protein
MSDEEKKHPYVNIPKRLGILLITLIFLLIYYGSFIELYGEKTVLVGFFVIFLLVAYYEMHTKSTKMTLWKYIYIIIFCIIFSYFIIRSK